MAAGPLGTLRLEVVLKPQARIDKSVVNGIGAPSLLASLLLGATLGCSPQREPPQQRSGAARPSAAITATPTVPGELLARPSGPAPQQSASATASAEPPSAAPPPPPWDGPTLAVTGVALAIYSEPRFDKDKKLGYARSGGRLPVKNEVVSRTSCSQGWYELRDGGYVCANQASLDLEHPQVKFALRAPALDEVLPYVYARNAKNGTPLYKSVPSREQMLSYEPYLDTGKKKKSPTKEEEEDEDNESAVPSADRRSEAGATPESLPAVGPEAGAPSPPASAAAPGLTPDAGPPEPPWWQREGKDHLHKVKLDDLRADSDDIMASRLVAGFYVAVDKTFSWNGRTWYKTTKGLVAPADRFWQTAGFKFQGVELSEGGFRLPVAWPYGGRKTAPTYLIAEGDKTAKNGPSVDTFTALQLTGREQELGGTRYLELAKGGWVKAIHVRVTRPGPPPAELKANERWVDVNVKTQTLVLFEGERPVFATLVSTGKESSVKAKDHRTPLGTWRIREKHLTTTMDGDGSAAGDLPYSIEDVPYVLYYYNSYALHTAFWHHNFGVQMSHGCVNMAPLDAKRVFFGTEPPLPPGWHGAWSSAARPGSLVVVHE